MKKTTLRLKLVKELGKGATGRVLEVVDEKGRTWALKKCFYERVSDPLHGVVNMKELSLLCGPLRHPYIQSAHTVFFETDPLPKDGVVLPANQVYDRCFFLMPKAKCTVHHLTHAYATPISHMKAVMYQLTSAVYYLHKNGIAHRDLKLANFLVFYPKKTAPMPVVRIADFGVAKPMNKVSPNSLHPGTRNYKDPCIMLCNADYSYGADIWSLACCFFEMVNREPLFRGDADMIVLNQIFRARGTPSQEDMKRISKCDYMPTAAFKPQPMMNLFSVKTRFRLGAEFEEDVVAGMRNPGTFQQFCDLLDHMFQVDPLKRYTIDEVLAHPFWDGFKEGDEKLYGLKIQGPIIPEDPVKEFPHRHDIEDWKVGVNEIAEFSFARTDHAPETVYYIKFHALDIYNRFLCRVEPFKEQLDYKIYAWICSYIASKYFLDVISDSLYTLFNESAEHISEKDIALYEQRVLIIIRFKIYEQTPFTYINSREQYHILLALMMNGPVCYQRRSSKIAELYDEYMLGDNS